MSIFCVFLSTVLQDFTSVGINVRPTIERAKINLKKVLTEMILPKVQGTFHALILIMHGRFGRTSID